WDANRYARDGNVLYLAHRAEILDQACEVFRRIFGNNVMTSKVHENNGYDPNAHLVFSTIQTMSRRVAQWTRDHFDYIVIDESHHVVAPTYRAVVSYFVPRFKLGITATPRRMDEQDILPTFEMNIAYNLPIERAIVLGYLASIDYKVFSDIVVGNLEEASGSALSLLSLSRQLFQERSLDEIVQLYHSEFDQISNPKALIFCPSIAFANQLHESYEDIQVVTGRTPARRRRSIISRFRSGSIDALATVDLFNEGIDIPDANLLVFLRSTSSETIFQQQLGRGLRKAPGKEAVHVLDFVAYLERLLYLKKFREGIETYRSEVDRLPSSARSSISPSRVQFDRTATQLIGELDKQRVSDVDLEILDESLGIDDLAEELSTKVFRLIPLIKRNIIKPDLRFYLLPGISYPYFLEDRLGEIKQTYRVWEGRERALPRDVPEIRGEGAVTFREELRTLEYPPALKSFYAQGKEFAKKVRIE
ncbi:MAG TPA: DEAD/DEAH box helicase family protein, partial [Candidatus Bathyarchaeia archaeon]